MRILVIEDERRTARYLQKGLSENGFVVDASHRHPAWSAGIDAPSLTGHNSRPRTSKGDAMTWEFITKPVHSTNAVSWEWLWRCIDAHGSVRTAQRTFTSFKECVADARIHGFTGEAEPGESGTLFQRPQFRFMWF